MNENWIKIRQELKSALKALFLFTGILVLIYLVMQIIEDLRKNNPGQHFRN